MDVMPPIGRFANLVVAMKYRSSNATKNAGADMPTKANTVRKPSMNEYFLTADMTPIGIANSHETIIEVTDSRRVLNILVLIRKDTGAR